MSSPAEYNRSWRNLDSREACAWNPWRFGSCSWTETGVCVMRDERVTKRHRNRREHCEVLIMCATEHSHGSLWQTTQTEREPACSPRRAHPEARRGYAEGRLCRPSFGNGSQIIRRRPPFWLVAVTSFGMCRHIEWVLPSRAGLWRGWGYPTTLERQPICLRRPLPASRTHGRGRRSGPWSLDSPPATLCHSTSDLAA